MEIYELSIKSPNILLSISGKIIRTPLKARVTDRELRSIISTLKSQGIKNFSYKSLSTGTLYDSNSDIPTIYHLMIEPVEKETSYNASRKITINLESKIDDKNDNIITSENNGLTNNKSNQYTSCKEFKIVELTLLSDDVLESLSKKIF